MTGDFNARSPLFWDEELIETNEGKKLANFACLNGLEQIINEPTHFPRDNVATCIDHIFTNQRHFIVDSGSLPSPDPSCKHSIIFGKIKLNLPTPPPYVRTIWEYNKANFDHIVGHKLD